MNVRKRLRSKTPPGMALGARGKQSSSNSSSSGSSSSSSSSSSKKSGPAGPKASQSEGGHTPEAQRPQASDDQPKEAETMGAKTCRPKAQATGKQPREAGEMGPVASKHTRSTRAGCKGPKHVKKRETLTCDADGVPPPLPLGRLGCRDLAVAGLAC